MKAHRITTLSVAVAIFMCVTGCSSVRDDLNGYNRTLYVSTIPKAVMADVHDYIRSSHIPASDISWTDYFEDGSGGHAIVIDQEIPGSNLHDVKCHELFYDKDNHRTKVRVRMGHRSC